ncbi:hypothetical protein PGB34_14960 [Xenophilus arseniciresistens]|uniref:Uncharacterized protein n=1 Tax=Xenophilus arseniciresistens TaxID=1283306 RepID=A0AAE3N9K4_9BURK|nr:hypothetical protein [Xenophilus arseniciresistens]MDA7417661.1 hypothetical protein [Xenophilus arseniciresistens]
MASGSAPRASAGRAASASSDHARQPAGQQRARAEAVASAHTGSLVSQRT